MSTFFSIERRRACAASLAIAATTFLGACGGGGGGGDAAPAGTPPAGSTVSNLDRSTFLIGLKVSVPGRPSSFEAFGTGFAIGDNLLATNSHVTRGVLETAADFARVGGTITGVSAIQSETGAEVVLLEALVHPSYNPAAPNLNTQDVGLFVTRDRLPNRLTLATPEEAGTLRKGDGLQMNGFPGVVFTQQFSDGFQPGLSVAQSSLFTGNVQALRNFDNRVVVDPPSEKNVDVYEYSMDTAPGTSGSPVLRNGKVVGVHFAGVSQVVLVVPPGGGQPRPGREASSVAARGVHVKHLHNLIKEFNTGVLAGERRFRLPPDPQLVASFAAGGGPRGGGVQTNETGGANTTFNGATVADPNNGALAHTLTFRVDANLNLTGTSTWPAFGNRPLRSFTLTGVSSQTGLLEFRDNTPEIVPGFRRGIYIGGFNSASGAIQGDYYELNETTNELFFFGNWTARR